MLRSNSVRTRRQVRFLRRQFLQEGELPFTDLLSKKAILQALADAELVWKDRIYTPLMTLWVFLSQVLSADHSCRGAVARLIAHRLSQGQALHSKRYRESSGMCYRRQRVQATSEPTCAGWFFAQQEWARGWVLANRKRQE